MKSVLKKSLAFLLCAAFCIGMVGCAEEDGDGTEESYIVVYEDDDSDDGTQGGNTSKDKTTSNNSSSKKQSEALGTTSRKASTIKDVSSRKKDLKGRKITYVAWWDGIDRTSTDGKILTQVEEMLNCKLVERNMSSYQALYSSILAGKPIADIFVPRTTAEVLNLANKGMLTPLNTLSNFDFSDQKWNQACKKESTLNGNVYSMTRKMQLRGLLAYNKTMFKKNGWDDLYTLQKNGKLDWAKLYSIMQSAAQVKDGTVTRYGLIPMYNISEIGFLLENANGVTSVSRTADTKTLKYNLNCDAGLTALKELNKWASKPGLLYDSTSFGWDTGRDVFISGKGAMLIADAGQVLGCAKKADFDIGVVLFPHGPNAKNDLAVYSINAEAIPAGVKNPNDVALFWDIFRDLLSDEDGLVLFKDTMTDESVTPTVKQYVSQFNSGKYVYDFGQAIDGVSDAFADVAYGKTTASSAISSLANTINGYITDFWK